MAKILSNILKVSDNVLSSYSETVTHLSSSFVEQYESIDFDLNISSRSVIITGIYASPTNIQVRIYDSQESRAQDIREYDEYESENLVVNGLVIQKEVEFGALNLSVNYSSSNNSNKLYCRVFNLGPEKQLIFQLKYLKLEDFKNGLVLVRASQFELISNKTHLLLANSPVELSLPSAGLSDLDSIRIKLCKEQTINSSLNSPISVQGFQPPIFLNELYKIYEYIYVEELNAWL